MEWQRDVVFADDIAQIVHRSRYPGGDAGEDCSRIERSGNTRCGSGTTPAVDRYMWVYVPLLGFLAVWAVLEGYMNYLYPRLPRLRIGIIPFPLVDDQCRLGSPHLPPHPRLYPRQRFIVSGYIRKMLLFYAQFLCCRQPARVYISIYSYRIIVVIVYIYRRMCLYFYICNITRTTLYFQRRCIADRPIRNSRSLLYRKVPASNWRK